MHVVDDLVVLMIQFDVEPNDFATLIEKFARNGWVDDCKDPLNISDAQISDQVARVVRGGRSRCLSYLLEVGLTATELSLHIRAIAKRKEEVEAYLASDMDACPHCQGEEIATFDDFDFEGPKAWCHVQCRSCQSLWKVHYTATDLTFTGKPGRGTSNPQQESCGENPH
jgi:hypothetical protein